MGTISEIDALKAVDDALAKIEDADTRDRILDWAFKKYSSSPLSININEDDSIDDAPVTKKKVAKKKAKSKTKGKAKSATTLSIVKDLNLKPSDKQTFIQFSELKKPSSNLQKCIVAVYYLNHELKLPNINIKHIYTCFKEAGWRLPADLANTLQYAASVNGWLDTSDSSDIKLSTHGDNLIEHDLPPKISNKKK